MTEIGPEEYAYGPKFYKIVETSFVFRHTAVATYALVGGLFNQDFALDSSASSASRTYQNR
jgi:hypothetical protein